MRRKKIVIDKINHFSRNDWRPKPIAKCSLGFFVIVARGGVKQGGRGRGKREGT